MLAGLVLGCGSAWGQRLPFQWFGPQQGLENLGVRSLLQDREGFVWVGTTNGLYRFEGLSFRAFRAKDGLPGDQVRGLVQSTDGSIWAATPEGLARWRGQGFETISTAPSARVSGLGSLAVDPYSRRLLVGTNEGLAVSAPGYRPPFTLVATDPEIKGSARGFWMDPELPGVLWYICGNRVCRRESTGKLVSYGSEAGLPESGDLVSVLRTPSGVLFVRSARHMYQRPKDAARFERLSDGPPPGGRFALLYLDPAGRLAVPTEVGIYLGGPGTWERLGERQGLPADTATCLLWDQEGRLWVGLESAGVARLSGAGRWHNWTTNDGLRSNTITSFARDGAGNFWIGTRFGLHRLLPDGSFQVSTEREGLPNEEIRSLYAAPDGSLWIGSGSGGLVRRDAASGSLRRFGPADGLANDQIVSLNPDPAGFVWVATRRGLFRAMPQAAGTRFEEISLPVKTPDRTVYRVLRARDGSLYFAGRFGLLREKAGAWAALDVSTGLRQNNVVFLTEDSSGDLWAGYGGVVGGARIRPAAAGWKVTHFSQAGGQLRSDNISFLERDRENRIWAGTDNGVDVFDGSAWHHLGTPDGLVWQDCTFGAFLGEMDGSAWIGTSRGFSRFRAPPRLASAPSPRVVLTQVMFGGTPVLEREPRIPYAARALEIRFATLPYGGEADLQYRYRLAGTPAPWEPVTQRELAFPSLAAGRRRLEISARRGDHPWSDPAAVLAFEILQPWWGAWWFSTLLAGAAGGVAWLAWRVRWRRHERRRRELEREVAARTREIEGLLKHAQEANRMKSEFLANVSHEIRTPMNAVLGMTGLALGTALDQEQREYLETVDSAARSLLHLLNDVLDFSKIEAGRLELETTPFAWRQTISEIVRPYAALARDKGLQFHVSLAPDVPDSLLGDPARLRQVLGNLLSNAIKFTAAGEVSLAVTRATEGFDPVHLQFCVRDSGIGIPPEKVHLVFDPFRQADGSTTRRYGGTGLGLAISARIVEAMGGRIEVQSRPGAGSLFRFASPFKAAPSSPLEPPRFAENACAILPVNARVLLVEDNEVNSRLAQRLLEKAGCLVTLARDGAEGLDRFRASQFDAVLMDLQMPVLDGLAATEQLRLLERGTGRRTPVVILTATAEASGRERALTAGADAYLTKPVDALELQQVLLRYR
jgi:signal transduction histidine kinase/ligand-binding sensor domain-containing protein/CheY-like chemotaxis protein